MEIRKMMKDMKEEYNKDRNPQKNQIENLTIKIPIT
jgi:hypothetical protein